MYWDWSRQEAEVAAAIGYSSRQEGMVVSPILVGLVAAVSSRLSRLLRWWLSVYFFLS